MPNSRARLLALAFALGIVSPTSASASVISVMTAAFTVIDDGGPDSYSVFFGQPLPVGTTGVVQVETLLLGVFADGARDGASLFPFSTPTVAEGLLSVGGGPPTTVTQVGGSDSFAGAGGTAGTVLLSGIALTDFGAPDSYTAIFGRPIPPFDSRVTGQGHLGAAAGDAGSDGVALTGQTPAGKIGAIGVTSPTLAEFGDSASTPGSALQLTGNGSYSDECDAPCSMMESGLFFQLSGGNDTAALLIRHEIGGSPIVGTVLKLYAPVIATSLFDCGSGPGCTAQELSVRWTGTGGGDAYGFVAVQRISTVAAPEPAMVSLVSLGLLAAAAARQRRRRSDRAI